MEKIDVDINASGVVTSTYTDELTGKMFIRREQDIEGVVEYATKLRNADGYSADGIKKGMWHVGFVPDVVIMELLQNGVDVYRDSVPKIVAGLKKINKEYLLTTNKRV
jgi:hypothetical protein